MKIECFTGAAEITLKTLPGMSTGKTRRSLLGKDVPTTPTTHCPMRRRIFEKDALAHSGYASEDPASDQSA